MVLQYKLLNVWPDDNLPNKKINPLSKNRINNLLY